MAGRIGAVFSVLVLMPTLSLAAQPGEKSPIDRSAVGSKSQAGPSADSLKSKKAEPINIIFKDGRLSGSFRNLTLRAVADAISRAAPIAVMVSDDSAGHLVSANLKDVPVDEAMRQMLGHEDVFFFYGAEGDKRATLQAVWIYPKGRGHGLSPIPPESWGSTKEISAGLTNKDPGVRAHSIEALIQRKGDAAKEQLMSALNDSSSEVRAEALYAAFQARIELPAETLQGLIHDSSPDVRFLALEASANSPDARSAAEALLNDPSEAVRSAAQALVSRLDEQAAPAAPPEPTRPPSEPN